MKASQLRTILWLRWRLTRNQWSRNGALDAALTMVVAVVALFIGLGGGLVGVLAGVFVLADAPSHVLLVVWDVLIGAFLFLWMIGVVRDIQRSETIDIGRMLHFPISLRHIFLLNYLASHLTFSVIVLVPGMIGLAVGLALGRGVSMLWMLPLVLGVLSIITAWTYCLRGWLVTLMVNQRRRRAIVAGITVAFIVICQLPNVLGNLLHDREEKHPPKPSAPVSLQPDVAQHQDSNEVRLPRGLALAHRYVPFLWVGNGVMSLADGKARPAALATAAAVLLGGLGLRRGYRSTVRFYRGQVRDRRRKPKPKAQRRSAAGRNFLEKDLPGISGDAAALSLAFFRSLSRAPEVKMALAINFVMLLIFGSMVFLRRSTGLADHFKPFVATGAIAFVYFGMLQLMFNQFGYDRQGFRVLVLSPVPRERILLGKNLALLPGVLGIGAALLVIVKFAVAVPFVHILASGVQLLAAFLLLSTAGNLISVLVPYRIAPGSMKATKMSTVTALLIAVLHWLFPIAVAPVLVPPLLGLAFGTGGELLAGVVNLVASAVLFGLTVLLYRLTLPQLGAFLQSREKRVLEVVTKEIE